MDDFYKLLNNILDWVVVITFSLVIAVGFLQVISRYIAASLFGTTFIWTEELSRYLFIYATFLGAVVATRDNDHITIDYFVNKMPDRLTIASQVGIRLLSLAFVIAAIWGGYIGTRNAWDTSAGTLPITMGYAYLVIPISFTLMGLFLIIQIKKLVLNSEDGDYDG